MAEEQECTFVDDRIAEIVTHCEDQTVVTKFYLIAEAIDGDGEFGMFRFFTDHIQPWQAIGLLEHALEMEKERIRRVERER